MIVLQDALELVMLAVLLHFEVDQEKAIESFTFDQMRGELKGRAKIVKSGTIKALNKQRILVKQALQQNLWKH